MADCSTDFERFLYANYPDDYRRATAKDVPDDVIEAILSKHARHYEIWRHIPEWIKDRYRDRLPRELLNGNETVKAFVEEEKHAKQQEEKETADLIGFGTALLAAGFAAETVTVLVQNREEREKLAASARGGALSGELLARWLETRESDRLAIENDYKENQPEKYIFHLIKELSRVNKRGQRLQNNEEKNGLNVKSAELQQKLEEAFEGLGGKENIAKLYEYLKGKPQQAAMYHLDADVQKMFFAKLKDKGISVTANEGKFMDEKEVKAGRESLIDSFKKSFLQKNQLEEIFESKEIKQDAFLTKIKERETRADKSRAQKKPALNPGKRAKTAERA